MKRNNWFGSLLLSALIFSTSLYGVQPKRIIMDSTADFSQGQVESVILQHPGQLKPGPQVKIMHDFENTLLWDAVELPSSKHLIIGTGPKGKVYRLDRKGRTKELTAFAESDVYAVAVNSTGEVFVASSPDGKVFKMSHSGDFEVWFEHGEKYVWDMLFGPDGRLYLATGETGKLFRVDGKNQGEVVFDAEEPHLRSMVETPTGSLIIGTTGSAMIYQYRPGQDTVVLLDALRTDISALAISDEGIIYAAAVGQKRGASSSSSTVVSSAQEQVLAAVSGLLTTNGADENKSKSAEAKPKLTKQPISNGNASVCEIYRIDQQHYPLVIHRSSDEIHSLAWTHQRLIAGAGKGGRFFEVRDNGDTSLLGSIESKQVTSILTGADGRIILLGSNWGKVAQLMLSKTEAGVYTSKVIDSGLFANWGSLKVAGEGKWSIRTRSGNTKDPDKSWHPWQFVRGEKSASPEARYFQFEVRLESGYVERIDFTYLPQNQKPSIKTVKALVPNQGYISIQQPPPATKIQTSGQLVKTQAPLPVSMVRYRAVSESGLRAIVWEASDPNGDQLRYTLEVRREGEQWEILAEDIDDTVFSWDTRGWPDGVYYARVSASDYVDNGVGKELVGLRISEAWRIDHASPVIKLVSQDADAVRVKVMDEGGVLEAVAVSENGQAYRMSIPEDGILDSEHEDFLIERNPMTPLYIRAKDENGNISGLHIPAEK